MTQEPRPHSATAGTSFEPDLSGRRFFIEDVYPVVDGGRFPVKRVVGEAVTVWADIFRDGHEVTAAALRWRRQGERRWQSATMTLRDNDRWSGSFVPLELGRYVFAVEAWTGGFATWLRDYRLKRASGVDIALELAEGRALVTAAMDRSRSVARRLKPALEAFDRAPESDEVLDDLAVVMNECEPRPDLTWSPLFPLVADRPRARCGAWYEIFPRSQSPEPGRHGTFADCIARLPAIAASGYDVLYFPPIHPIGRTNRKGRNNALTAAPDDPGSPYAIGSEDGGHDAVHPQLGTLEDFRRLREACEAHELEIALDFAVQFSPDHPWVEEHPQWFRRRADGSIRYAENPPKKYEDIINPDFYCDDRAALWAALRDVVLFWASLGVRIFRVDNPHTKPFPFWEWLIREVQARYPDAIFLAEAFTRPKVMKALAKLGFTQSYTYFTWRTTKDEISAYLTELTGHPEREFYRPNFFVNTPDILPVHLQKGEPWMFKSRVALAATLSSNYGVYSGFELLEHTPIPGREEYLDSEKYEIKARDWNAPGNIGSYIARLNELRRAHPALQQTADLRFGAIDHPDVIGFVKQSGDHKDVVAVAIALSGSGPFEFWFHFGDLEIGPPEARRRIRVIENLVTGQKLALEWGGVRLAIDPSQDPALLFRCFA